MSLCVPRIQETAFTPVFLSPLSASGDLTLPPFWSHLLADPADRSPSLQPAIKATVSVFTDTNAERLIRWTGEKAVARAARRDHVAHLQRRPETGTIFPNSTRHTGVRCLHFQPTVLALDQTFNCHVPP